MDTAIYKKIAKHIAVAERRNDRFKLAGINKSKHLLCYGVCLLFWYTRYSTNDIHIIGFSVHTNKRILIFT